MPTAEERQQLIKTQQQQRTGEAIIPINIPQDELEKPVNPVQMYVSFFKANLPLFGVIIVAISLSYLIGRWEWSLLWLLPVAYSIWFIGKRRVEQFETYHTNRVERTLARERLPSSPETCEWINHIIERFWGVFEPAISAQVIDNVNAVLRANKPAFLDSIELSEFTLGSSAPAILGAQVYPHVTDADNIQVDLEMSFVPSDSVLPEVYLPYRKRGYVWNSKIVLSTRIGRGIVGVDVPVMINEIMFHGKLRAHLTLAPSIPFVKTVQVCFMQDPDFDFILKPLKALDIMDLPGLSNWLNSTIRTNVHAQLVNPNKITIDVMELLAAKKKGEGEGKAIGIAKITVFQVRGLKEPKGSSVRVSVAGKFKATTGHLKEEATSWNEVFYVMIATFKYPLTFNVQGPSTSLMSASSEPLGSCKVSLDDPDDLKNKGWRHLTARGGSSKGSSKSEVKLTVEYFPTLESTDDQIAKTLEGGGASTSKEVEAITQKISKSPNGVLHLIVHSAKELQGRKSWSPFVEIEVESALSGEAHRKKLEPEYDFYHKRTVTKKRTNTPNWEQNFEFLIADINSDEIKLRVRDSKEDQDLGHLTGKISEFVKTGTSWYTMEGVETGRIYLTFLYNPVAIPGGIVPSGEMIYVPAIGIARITVQKATNIEDLLMKQDYYATITSNDALVGKTRKAKADKGIQGEIVYQETFDVLVKTTDDDIAVALFTEGNLMMGDEEVGKGKIKLSEPNSIFATTIDLGKDRNISVSSLFLPISEDKDHPKPKLQPGSLMLGPDLTGNCGILKLDGIVIEGVTARSIISTEKRIKLLPEVYITPMTVVKLSSESSREGTFKWKEPLEMFIADTVKDQFHIVLYEEKDLGGNECIVSLRVPIKQLKAKAWYQLFDHEGKPKEKSRIYFEGEFRPISTKIPGRPDDQGTLNLEIKSASNLKAVDSGGTSDPYVQVLLNDKKMMKTSVQKKNNKAPVWKESFELDISSRSTSQLELQVRDWNPIQASELLGSARLDLVDLPEGQQVAYEAYKLLQTEIGTLSFSLRFTPKPHAELDKIGPAYVEAPTTLLGMPGKAFTGAADTTGKIFTGAAAGTGKVISGAAAGTGKVITGTGKAITDTGKAFTGAVGGVFGMKKKEEHHPGHEAGTASYGLKIHVKDLVPSAFLMKSAESFDVHLKAASGDGNKLWKSKSLKKVKTCSFNDSFDVLPKIVKSNKVIEFPFETSLSLEQLALPAGTKPMFRLELDRPELSSGDQATLSLPLNGVAEEPALVLNLDVKKDYSMHQGAMGAMGGLFKK